MKNRDNTDQIFEILKIISEHKPMTRGAIMNYTTIGTAVIRDVVILLVKADILTPFQYSSRLTGSHKNMWLFEVTPKGWYTLRLMRKMLQMLEKKVKVELPQIMNQNR